MCSLAGRVLRLNSGSQAGNMLKNLSFVLVVLTALIRPALAQETGAQDAAAFPPQ